MFIIYICLIYFHKSIWIALAELCEAEYFRYHKVSMRFKFFFFLTLKNDPKIGVELELGFWLTNKYQCEREYRQLWLSLCTSNAEWMHLHLEVCSVNSKHSVNLFLFCLSHALSCMLTHANHLPWHCGLLELRIKEFILKMPRGKTEVCSTSNLAYES